MRWDKREDNKAQSYQTQGNESEGRAVASDRLLFVEAVLQKIGCRRGNKENCNINPIGRFSEYAVVGVKQYGDGRKPHRHSYQFYAPKILAFTEKAALDQPINKHRKVQKLHMLPCGFIHPGEGRGPCTLSGPVVQKMQ